MIKAKDPRLALIDVAVPGFLTKPPLPPPPLDTQDAQLPAPLAAKLLYSYKQPFPSDDEREKPTTELTQEDIDKNFEVFYQEDPEDSSVPAHHHLVAAQVSTNQEGINIPEAMVLKEKTLDPLALLTAHALRRGMLSWYLLYLGHLLLPLPTPLLLKPPRRKEKKGNKPRTPKKGKYPNPYNNHRSKSLK